MRIRQLKGKIPAEENGYIGSGMYASLSINNNTTREIKRTIIDGCKDACRIFLSAHSYDKLGEFITNSGISSCAELAIHTLPSVTRSLSQATTHSIQASYPKKS